VSGGPLAHFLHIEDAAPVALVPADLTGKSVPGHTVQPLPTHVAVGGARVGARKPAVLALEVLQGLQNSLQQQYTCDIVHK